MEELIYRSTILIKLIVVKVFVEFTIGLFAKYHAIESAKGMANNMADLMKKMKESKDKEP